MKKTKNKKTVRLDAVTSGACRGFLDQTSCRLPESFLQAFPNLREVIRRADAQVKAFIEIEADISRQFHEKGYAELDDALLRPPYRIHFKKKKKDSFPSVVEVVVLLVVGV